MMIERSLDVDRKQCPIIDLDGKIDYRYPMDAQPKMLNPIDDEVDTGSIFDIIDEPTVEESNSSSKSEEKESSIPGINNEEFIYVPYVI